MESKKWWIIAIIGFIVVVVVIAIVRIKTRSANKHNTKIVPLPSVSVLRTQYHKRRKQTKQFRLIKQVHQEAQQPIVITPGFLPPPFIHFVVPTEDQWIVSGLNFTALSKVKFRNACIDFEAKCDVINSNLLRCSAPSIAQLEELLSNEPDKTKICTTLDVTVINPDSQSFTLRHEVDLGNPKIPIHPNVPTFMTFSPVDVEQIDHRTIYLMFMKRGILVSKLPKQPENVSPTILVSKIDSQDYETNGEKATVLEQHVLEIPKTMEGLVSCPSFSWDKPGTYVLVATTELVDDFGDPLYCESFPVTIAEKEN